MIYLVREAKVDDYCLHPGSSPRGGEVAYCDLKGGHWIFAYDGDYGVSWQQAGRLRSWWYSRKFLYYLHPSDDEV